MLEPSLQFQSAVRAALIGDAAFAALVTPENVRSVGGGPSTRMPSVILGDAQTQFLGYAAGGQMLARVFLTAHVWAPEDGADTGKAIGFALFNALLKAPATGPDYALDDYSKPSLAWMRDPSPEGAWTHGIVELEGIIRWKV